MQRVRLRYVDSRDTPESEGTDIAESNEPAHLWLAPEPDAIAWSFRPSGRTTVWDWTAGDPNPRELDPVRRPVSGALSRHIPVRAFSLTTGAHLRLESGLEHDLLRQLDRDTGVTWLVPQPCRLAWPGPRRATTTHTPDLLSVSTQERITLWDVKRPEAAAAESFVRVSTVTRLACDRVGWRYRVFTGLTAVHRHNLIWLHAYRRRPAWADRYEQHLLDLCAAGPSLGELIANTDDAGRAVIWHLIWADDIKVDLTARLTATTEVSA